MKGFVLFFCLFVTSLFSAEDIEGFWKTIDDETGKPQCIIAVYPHNGIYYGRIIATFGPDGKIEDSIYHPKKRAPGVVGDPFYSGLDIIWDLVDSGSKFKGKILDPEKGNIYKSELWIDNGDLVVRGKLFIFGRNQIWLPVGKAEFPKGFKIPSLKNITPKIPEVK